MTGSCYWMTVSLKRLVEKQWALVGLIYTKKNCSNETKSTVYSYIFLCNDQWELLIDKNIFVHTQLCNGMIQTGDEYMAIK